MSILSLASQKSSIPGWMTIFHRSEIRFTSKLLLYKANTAITTGENLIRVTPVGHIYNKMTVMEIDSTSCSHFFTKEYKDSQNLSSHSRG